MLNCMNLFAPRLVFNAWHTATVVAMGLRARSCHIQGLSYVSEWTSPLLRRPPLRRVRDFEHRTRLHAEHSARRTSSHHCTAMRNGFHEKSKIWGVCEKRRDPIREGSLCDDGELTPQKNTSHVSKEKRQRINELLLFERD